MAVAEENLSIFRDYEEKLGPLHARSAESESFYRNKQYTRRERNQLRQFGLIPLVINIVRPFLLQRRAILTSSRPSQKVVPLQGGSKLIAAALNQILVGKWNSDYTDIQLNKALKDLLITGRGFLFIDCASFLDNATFDVVAKHLGWRYVFPDPTAREFDLSDAENILVKRNIGMNRAQVVYKLTREQAEGAAGLSSNTMGFGNKQVEAIDRYSKFPITEYTILPKEGAELHDIPNAPFYTEHLEEAVKTEKTRLLAEMKVLESEGKVDIRKMKDLRIHRFTSVGQQDIHSGIMNIRDYPVIPFLNEEGDTYADVLGDVEFIKGMQKVENKFYLLTIHNAMLTGNVRFLGPRDAVKDVKQFQRNANIPGSYNAYEPNPLLPDGGKPEVIQPGQLSSAFYNISKDMMELAKFETSVYDPISGNPQNTPETFSTTATLQEFGTQTIKELARRVDIGIAKAGEVMIQFIQNYTQTNELIEFIDLTGEYVAPQDADGQNIVLNEQLVEAGVVKEIKNNTRIGKYSVKVLTQPNLGTDRLAKAAFMRDMIMNQALPPTPTVLGKLFDLMEFPQAASITKDIQEQGDAKAQVEQLTAQVEQLSAQSKKMEAALMELEKQNELLKFKGELQKELAAIKSAGQDKMLKLERAIDKVNGETQDARNE